jgi:sn-glycerol 3-phosphate transport system substrate-binding protein
MRRRDLLAGLSLAATGLPARAQAPAAETGRIRIVFWHAMSGALLDEVGRVARAFNDSQSRYVVDPVFKGGYVDALISAVAASRAGQPPHILQVYEVGTGTMVYAGPAIKPAWQLFQETGVAVDPATYIPAVRGYYSLPDGRLASMPFNSSTAMMWLNRDAFERAGLDADHPPATWQAVLQASQVIKAKGAAEFAFTGTGTSWTHFEQYSAIHDLPFATLANGFDGLGAELRINSPAHVKHLQWLIDAQSAGLFKYNGRDRVGDPTFPAGRAAMTFGSSGNRGTYSQSAKFPWVEAMLPYDPEVIARPINSIIGGASLWTLTAPGRTAEEYRGVAEFLTSLAAPEMDALWHERTGYVPITFAGYDRVRQDGYYQRNPGADLPIRQLSRGTVTPNSRGFRLGRMPEVRDILEEEVEGALQGRQGAQQALDNAVNRGNVVLRQFQRSARA